MSCLWNLFWKIKLCRIIEKKSQWLCIAWATLKLRLACREPNYSPKRKEYGSSRGPRIRLLETYQNFGLKFLSTTVLNVQTTVFSDILAQVCQRWRKVCQFESRGSNQFFAFDLVKSAKNCLVLEQAFFTKGKTIFSKGWSASHLTAGHKGFFLMVVDLLICLNFGSWALTAGILKQFKLHKIAGIFLIPWSFFALHIVKVLT